LELTVKTKPDPTGFWYAVRAAKGAQYYLEYLVVGTGSRNASGEISGHVRDAGDWEFVHVGFPVLGVGLTHLDCSFENGAEPIEKAAEEPQEEPEEITNLSALPRIQEQNRRRNHEDQTEIDHEVFPQSQLATSNPEPGLSEWDDSSSSESGLLSIGTTAGLEHAWDSHQYPYPYPYPYPP